MKRALTIYIDNDCEITALSITILQENQSGKPSITISTGLGTGGKNLYLPFKDERPNRSEPIYFNDGDADDETDITKVNEADKLLYDYGIKDISTLEYILDQYQKVIVNITNGRMSYLTYPAEAILSVASDIYNEDLEKAINDAVTNGEYQPVKHGRWESCCNLMGEYFKCSECGYKAEVPTCMGEPIFIYCPNCGAKMDGESE